MQDSKNQSNEDLSLLFNESEDTEEFYGFSDNSIVDKSDSEESDTDDELHQSIVKKQRNQINKKKEMLKSLMEELDQSPLFVKMKTSSPKELLKIHQESSPKPRVRANYFHDPPLTRQRSGSKKLHGPLKTRSFFTVKFVERQKAPFKKVCRQRFSFKSQPHVILPVEDVTPTMINDIAAHSVGKHYDTASGTSCHQCRQKTLDTKSCCRSTTCVGVRGQFCGPCLKNRYGESVAEALLDPEWTCPVCRGFCNCSICRNRNGKCATGILIGLARQSGYSNVKSYLEALASEREDD